MTKTLDDAAIERAFRAAERKLAARDPDTLAGRFASQGSPKAEQALSTPITHKRVKRA